MAFRTPTDYVNKVPRSTHNQSLDVRTTLHPGLAIPIYHDTLDLGESRLLDLSSLLQAEPFLAPYMGGFELRLHVFFDPLRNYYSWIDNNDKRTTEDILDSKKHRFDFPYGAFNGLLDEESFLRPNGQLVTTNPELIGQFFSNSTEEDFANVVDYSRCVVGKNSLASYLGIPSGSVPVIRDGQPLPYNLQPFLTYLNIWRCYYSNNQETVAPYTKGWFLKEQYDVTRDGVEQFGNDIFLSFGMNATGSGIQALDELFKKIRYSDDGLHFTSPLLNNASSEFDSPSLNLTFKTWLFNSFKPFGGLMPVMYKPDMYRNLLSSEVGQLKRYVKVDPDQNAISIQELRTENAWQRLVDRYDISGGRYSEWARTIWGVTSKKGIHIPDLLAVRSTFIGAQNIKATATTESSEGSTQLGQLASVIDSRNAFKPFKVRASEPGVLMVVASLVPFVDYSQGLDVSWTRTNFSDDYNPEMQQLNWMDVSRSIYTSLPLRRQISYALGNQPVDTYISDISVSYVEKMQDSVFALSTSSDFVIGKQIPWIEKMSAVNRLSGEFDNDGIYSYWVGRRRYTRNYIVPSSMIVRWKENEDDENFQEKVVGYFENGSEESFSQYVNPMEWQYMFKDQSIFKHNFFLQVGIAQPRNVKPIGYRYMPSLER